jgi:hypothetical protein
MIEVESGRRGRQTFLELLLGVDNLLLILLLLLLFFLLFLFLSSGLLGLGGLLRGFLSSLLSLGLALGGLLLLSKVSSAP